MALADSFLQDKLPAFHLTDTVINNIILFNTAAKCRQNNLELDPEESTI